MQKKISAIPLVMLIPSAITMFALCLGATSIRYALEGSFQVAIALIIIAAIMDALDGKVARLLNSTTDFGAQLDSLADLVSFGVAPGLIIYIWSLEELAYKGMGWAIILFYITCSAFRLARFNMQIGDETKSEDFFTGIPMPAAAGLVLLPIMFSFNIVSVKLSNLFIAPYIILIGAMMISRLPTLSFKKVVVQKEYVVPLLVLTVIIMAGILMEPWVLLPVLGVLYIFSIPITTFYYYRSRYNNK
jgi:CDP-diacylglycerol---serine O-phosphatidyltransferase